MIMNGSYDKKGVWTYIGETGKASVVDYVIANKKAEENIKKVEEGNSTESDHVPIEVELEGHADKKTKKEDKSNRKKRLERKRNKKLSGMLRRIDMRAENEDIWQELKLKNSITKIKQKIGAWRLGKKEWHSTDWKREKRYLRTMMRKIKKGKIKRKEYVQKRKDYKIWCKEEKRRHEEEEKEKKKNISIEKEAWKYINKYRRKREGIDEGIELET